VHLRDFAPSGRVQPTDQIDRLDELLVDVRAPEVEGTQQRRSELAEMAVAVGEQVKVIVVERTHDPVGIVDSRSQFFLREDLPIDRHALFSDDEYCRTYCLTGKWHPAAGCCLRKKYTLDQLK
jgi:hypothetical protein